MVLKLWCSKLIIANRNMAYTGHIRALVIQLPTMRLLL